MRERRAARRPHRGRLCTYIGGGLGQQREPLRGALDALCVLRDEYLDTLGVPILCGHEERRAAVEPRAVRLGAMAQ